MPANLAFIPPTQPKDGNSRQLRRRFNAAVAVSDANVTATQSNAAAIATKAPSDSPTFTGTVTQAEPPTLTSATTATSATSGSASSLPSTPQGYLQMIVNGETVKMPYYKP